MEEETKKLHEKFQQEKRELHARYVIETNLMQRSFSDLEISEKAAVLKEQYDKVLYQR